MTKNSTSFKKKEIVKKVISIIKKEK